jgi:hypothetical protein
MTVKLCNQSVDLLIRPIVDEIGAGELWESGFHYDGLFAGTLFDAMALIRRDFGESLLEGFDIEEGNWKGTDATVRATGSAGDFSEQGSGCPLEPVVGLLVQPSRVRWSSHGGSFHLNGKIDDEITLG